ncbi:MAG: MBL fold metallo-hydrolase [Bacteroidota bacterium]
MPVEIFDFKFGINHCYLIKDKGAIIIDSGPPFAGKNFLKKLADYSIAPKEIKLIVLTHGDFDHAGCAKEMQEICGAKIAIHEKDRINLEEGIFNWPKGVTTWGKISRSLLLPLLKNNVNLKTVKADIVLDGREMSLEKYGIDGKIIYTPGHTIGSVSVLLDSGEAFVGCMAHSGFPFRLSPGLPIYAENIDLLKESWKLLIDRGGTMIYPAHGNPFPAEEIKKYIYR